MYADREGHIGYQSPGRIPIRRSGNDGTMPVEGWISANDWTGDYIPFDGLPSVLDPDEGFIVTANQAVIGEDYPYLLTEDWDYGYRSTRIRELLDRRGRAVGRRRWRASSSTRRTRWPRCSCPTSSTSRTCPARYYRNAQDLLRDWDFTSARRQRAGGVLQRGVAQPARADLPRRPARARSWPDGGDRWFRVVGAMLPEPAGPWWDDVDTDDVVETRDDILRAGDDRRPATSSPGARRATRAAGPGATCTG